MRNSKLSFKNNVLPVWYFYCFNSHIFETLLTGKKMKKIFVIIFCLFSGAANAALILGDDFNDGVMSGWTVQSGSVNESGGFISGAFSLATFNGQFSDSIAVDAISNPGLDYIALVLNYTSLSDNLFVKIQDNNSNGLFDRIFFYHGNNGVSGIAGTYFFDLAFEVASSYFEVTDNGDGTVSAFVGATNQTFGGTLTNTYSGTGIGLGFYGNGQADNFYIETTSVPEPASLALLGLSLAGLAFSKRKKSA